TLAGYVLCIGVGPTRGPNLNVIDFGSLVTDVQNELATALKADSYWALPPFDRRDKMATVVTTDEFRAKLAGQWIIARGVESPDAKHFLISSRSAMTVARIS
ncbi:hypothetical protein IIB49_00660, partial [Patescibacteria group bacterium]|nr:hypothetical protein [Patescibacteria group bacterium]